jgi:hypothetical protein
MVASRVRARCDMGCERWSKDKTGTGDGGGISAGVGKENFCLLVRSCAVRLLVFRWELAQRKFFRSVCREALRLSVFLEWYRVTSR